MENSLLLSGAKLYYPSAREWMWYYCIYLGPFTDSEGLKYDLGIYIDTYGQVFNASVYGTEPGNYYSGDTENETFKEACRRAELLGII